jgi:hypothetical protein
MSLGWRMRLDPFAQGGIHTGLPTLARSLEGFQHVSVQANRLLKAFDIGQRQTVLVEVAFILGRVEFVVHMIYCINTNGGVKHFL